MIALDRVTRRRFLRFLLVGGTATLSYAVLAGLVAARWPALKEGAGVGLYLAFVPPTWLAQRRFVFRSRDTAAGEFGRYALVQALSIGVASLVLARLATADPLWNTAVYLANAVAGAGVSFLLCSLLVFRRRAEAGDEVQLAAADRA